MNRAIFALLAALPLAACMFSSSDNAAQERVTNCRSACDKMKFFDCNTADDHATCYDQCRTANAQQVDTFTACANSSICDAACRGAIVQKPAAAAGSAAPGSNVVVVNPTAPGNTAPASPLCEKVCSNLVTCGAATAADKGACLTKCGATTGADKALSCIANSACADLNKCSPLDVGGGTGGTLPSFDIMMCTQQCDVLHSSSCISADDHASCTSKCTTATAVSRSAFTSCAQGTSDCERGKPCFTTFDK